MMIAASHGASPRRDALFAPATPTSTTALAATILVAALAWTWLVRLPLFRLDCLDDAGYVGLAHFWTRGVLPYARIFDFKPPGLFALVALAQSAFGPTLESLRAVSIASDALAATGLFFLARRFGRPAVGLFAAALYPILSEIAIGNDAYCPLAALTILAFLAALSPLSPLRRSVLAGLAIGAAATVKQTAGFEAMALLAILTLAPDAAPGRVRAALAFILAAALAPLGFLLYFAWRGAAGALIADTVVGALARPASASEGLSFAGGLLRFLPLQKGLLPLTGLCVLALARARARRRGAALSPRRGLGVVRRRVRLGDRPAFVRAILSRPDARPGAAARRILCRGGRAGAGACPAMGAARRAGAAFARGGARRARRRFRPPPGRSGPRGRRAHDRGERPHARGQALCRQPRRLARQHARSRPPDRVFLSLPDALRLSRCRRGWGRPNPGGAPALHRDR
jgi:hypothetical protein